jgi:16S rRNA (cytosine1402-N4)-methyltransferase
MENTTLSHVPVLLKEVLSFLPAGQNQRFLDCTAGGGGHFFEILKRFENISVLSAQCWDRDPLAKARIEKRAADLSLSNSYLFKLKTFSVAPNPDEQFEIILADLGISSFQLDDPARGLSLHSDQAPDFRMNPEIGLSFSEWLETTPVGELESILRVYGEEPKAHKLAKALKNEAPPLSSAKVFADWIAKILAYPPPSRRHPATRTFQAFRIAINQELQELESLLKWAPEHLAVGGVLMIISFHSLEDRMVKRRFRDLAESGCFDILTKKPVDPSEAEVSENPRARSAHLRVLTKTQEDPQHKVRIHETKAQD